MNFLYIAQCGLPDTAAGIRIYQIARLLRDLGHNVTFLCRMKGEVFEKKYDGFRYLFDTIENKHKHRIDSLFAYRSYLRIKRELNLGDYQAMIIYNDSSGLTNKLLRYKGKYKLYADVTEWYSLQWNNTIWNNFYALRTTFRIKYTDHLLNGVIAISPYLHSYYSSIGMNSVMIPPLIDVFSYELGYRDLDKPLNLIYAGTPGTKDILTPVFEAIEMINKDAILITFRILGIDKDQLKKQFGRDSGSSGIIAMGYIPHYIVLSQYKTADFSILFRKKKRYAKAGYSTKFCESLTLGVPVICNKVGGADTDIINGVNGFRIDSVEVNVICNLLKYVLSLSKEQVYRMKNSARIYAMARYSLAGYKNVIWRLINV